MMTPDTSNTPSTPEVDQRRGSFQRGEGFDMTVGRVLTYTLMVSGFTIVAHRFGISWRGTIPVVTRRGLLDLIKIQKKAVLHHEHLKASYDAGEQSYLTEEQVSERLSAFELNISARVIDVGGNIITGP